MINGEAGSKYGFIQFQDAVTELVTHKQPEGQAVEDYISHIRASIERVESIPGFTIVFDDKCDETTPPPDSVELLSKQLAETAWRRRSRSTTRTPVSLI